ncbi:uncharacterized protein LOC8276598 [Ricinus communis]|uniref:uncharacterized protein LOC8276598 n=1 Tax=Ricinus communis TaxID=3988 RepID=UPI00201B2EED|nr:uncharacterized protein LOC8276598 [Ricinus communis]
MASSIPKLLLLLSLIASLLISVSARPCKTLFISSYTFSIRPLNPNPNSNNPSSGFVTIVTEITQKQQRSSEVFLDPRFFRAVGDDNSESQQVIHQQQQQKEEGGVVLPFGLGLSSYDINSLRDRTKDILSVVVALLFGVGCGALTAATMYLVWSLFSTRYNYHYGEFDDEDDEDEDEDVSPKKMGYVKISEVHSVPKQAAV